MGNCDRLPMYFVFLQSNDKLCVLFWTSWKGTQKWALACRETHVDKIENGGVMCDNET